MKQFPPVRGRACVWALVAAIGGFMASSSRAQVPSPLDTMRVVSVPDAHAGESFAVDLHLRNMDTLGAYSVRLRYDPALIRPVLDTFMFGSDTMITVVVEQLRGVGFDIFAAGTPESGVLTFLASDFDLDAATLFLPGSGVSARLTWYAVPNAPATTTTLAFENDPVFPQSWNMMADISGLVDKRPTLIDGTVMIDGGCPCNWHGDVNLNGVEFEIGDFVLLVDVIFRGVPLPASPDLFCPVERGDLDCNGVLDVLDALRLQYLMTGDWPYPEGICDPCAGTPTAALNTHTVTEGEVAR